MSEEGILFEELLKLMETLRSPNGCEWDREQTHESLKPYLIEEAYEVVHSIDEKDLESLKEELGDLLLQVVFHAQIAKENGEFDMKDVISTLNSKLVRRHPHVFGDSKGYSYEQWEKIKAQEKGGNNFSKIGNINKALPSLSLARRIQENAAAVGFDWISTDDVMKKVKEELSELEDAMKNHDEKKMKEEFGDLLFAIVNLSRFLGIEPEGTLREATEKFIRRFEKMAELIEKDGKKIENSSVQELDTYWEESKKSLKEVSDSE
ncbi:MAG: tetrapyrrole methylase family protein / MazG family protein [Thermotogaceae bacterium]|nr:tetrapyrrole methylase family protein / MazG family protein [Thermotogaceae bacterium]MDN5337967.1 tetrapyrrole methylase family protein / MazG family protein [Thermotogaceae bacterium]